jgi:hypothetical protein
VFIRHDNPQGTIADWSSYRWQQKPWALGSGVPIRQWREQLRQGHL